mmetsp:Transcript_22108/g.33620  ORF Transcript_22108/g.33620 Transcript_22108/m.33620 type:complete len:561 (-) Transcript_22108:138-1820(-)|eukprot:CAMPEP_0194117668 /NCGR_PEP_ID=MMETSP0150-20130528/32297_1 /TAXON_ID=122233 /ORGANISM="Chaetoceros debilis, Strain MM31A-1" /LENGTH=560 /DNA_ID=CAMNT_0038808785 /DNA_START=47 /DNA_END=1729 /DNA_ORIENTATION=+
METRISIKRGKRGHLMLFLLAISILLQTFGQSSALQTPTPVTPRSPNPNNFNPNKEPPNLLQVAGVYAVAPAIPLVVLPILADTFRATQNPTDLLAVLVAKRGFLYLLATLATAYAGWRASTSLPAGKSLDNLNREILKGEYASETIEEESLSENGNTLSTSISSSQVMQKNEVDKLNEDKDEDKDEPIFALLDEVDGVNQNVAFALPFVLAAALSASYLLLSQGTAPVDPAMTENNIDVLSVFSQFSTLSNLAVCLLFSAAEYRSFGGGSNASSDKSIDNYIGDRGEEKEFPQNLLSVPNVTALFAVAAASLLPLSLAWPIQNSVNIALAVTVTRALAPFLMEESGSIRIIALALTGLATYDVFSVFGTSLLSVQAAGALDALDAESFVAGGSLPGNLVEISADMAADMKLNMNHLVHSSGVIDVESSSIITAAGDASKSGSSVMETVARAKLEGPWRPGLLEMVLVGRVSDVLGLGDIVFPACLVSWGYTFNIAYAYAAIAGYILGSLLTEVASTLGPAQGLPALIFLAPAMLGSVSLLAIIRGETERVWGQQQELQE